MEMHRAPETTTTKTRKKECTKAEGCCQNKRWTNSTIKLTEIHFAQIRSYLKATGLKVGLILNFAKPTLGIKRVVD
jgi:hypothetical protein